ncbi:hypothetical protein [uncultured Thalassospira sp.]|uniref:hypothetical protein n=1 Tax=uncultured Thalassospira sp. TaxID=404382 RepID=UPI0030DB457B|tara:strand:+ start:2544 stop:2714 length:171 start_codon:yes stop_codon:yes gene_type:complete
MSNSNDNQFLLSQPIIEELSLVTAGGTADYYKAYAVISRDVSNGNISIGKNSIGKI